MVEDSFADSKVIPVLLETRDDFIHFIQHFVSFARDGRDDGLTCVITIYSLHRSSRI